MKYITLITLSLLFGTKSFYHHDQQIDLMLTNNLHQSYVVSDHHVVLIDSKGKKLFDYNNIRNGTISSIDQVSSLRTMVFYNEQSAFVLLDNTMSEVGPIMRLDQLNLYYISLMCASENNHYWCYSNEQNAVLRINPSGDIVSSGMDLHALLHKSIHPTMIKEHHGKLYMNDPENGIHVFDNYGSYEKTIPILHAEQVVLQNDQLFYLLDKRINQFDLKQKLDQVLFQEAVDITQFSVQSDQLYYCSGQEVFVMKIPVLK